MNQPPCITEKEDILIDCLRNDINHFLETKYCSMPFWHERHKRLLYLIHNDDPRDFTNWDIIQGTMFHCAVQMEYKYLTQSKDWSSIKFLLKEDKIGNPAEYEYMQETSGNLIHHLYSFLN